MKQISFNRHFGVTGKTEYVDILLKRDLELFIDPYNIVNNLDKRIAKKLYLRSKTFLETLNRNYILPNDRKHGLPFLSHLKEPNEYGLGYSHEKKGKGVGKSKAEVIFDSLRNNRFAKAGVTITNEAHNVLLLVKGIGQDNMSDILANVCRDIFAEFTYQQCLKHGIPTYATVIEYFDPISKKWKIKEVQLPFQIKPIILVPKFLINGGRAYTGYYNWFIMSNHLSKDIIQGKIKITDDSRYLSELKDGSKKAIIKNINRDFKKPKGDLVDFAQEYNDSLLGFQIHIKENFESIDDDKLSDMTA
ncbi:hypothetical protein [Flavobacterium mekongense]|uniref:hypothetical protein n=1 Tax=Flavobacterium mekongense TaxID=3379707 RepID=UPI00399B953E